MTANQDTGTGGVGIGAAYRFNRMELAGSLCDLGTARSVPIPPPPTDQELAILRETCDPHRHGSPVH